MKRERSKIIDIDKPYLSILVTHLINKLTYIRLEIVFVRSIMWTPYQHVSPAVGFYQKIPGIQETLSRAMKIEDSCLQ